MCLLETSSLIRDSIPRHALKNNFFYCMSVVISKQSHKQLIITCIPLHFQGNASHVCAYYRFAMPCYLDHMRLCSCNYMYIYDHYIPS